MPSRHFLIRRASLLVVLGLAASAPAAAAGTVGHGYAFETAARMVRPCAAFLKLAGDPSATPTIQEAYDAGRCAAYTIAVVDAAGLSGVFRRPNHPALARVCLPSELSTTDLVTHVARFLEERRPPPATGAIFVVQNALARAYPCR